MKYDIDFANLQTEIPPRDWHFDNERNMSSPGHAPPPLFVVSNDILPPTMMMAAVREGRCRVDTMASSSSGSRHIIHNHTLQRPRGR
mmetsp:Transcript_37947/g.69697  ORF Transcript_37947/g.69697 Transcript_37947/m.69697 type:complete len:87 (-) Transcript_37947:594-854(-)